MYAVILSILMLIIVDSVNRSKEPDNKNLAIIGNACLSKTPSLLPVWKHRSFETRVPHEGISTFSKRWDPWLVISDGDLARHSSATSRGLAPVPIPRPRN